MTSSDVAAPGDADAGHRPDGRLAYRWVAMLVVLFGTFMVVLDTTVVNLGLASMQREFGVEDGIEWIVTSYLAAVGVAQTCSGWLADRAGRRSVFIWAMVVFTIGSLLCAIAPTLPVLVVARVVQGLGGGLMLPTGMATIFEQFQPNERGRALGYFGIAIMAAPAIGPVVGGGLVESLSWRWLFLINLPIGIVGIPIAVRLLRDTGYRDPTRRLDGVGLAFAGSGLVAFLVGVSEGGLAGWSQPHVILLISVGLVLLALFVRHVHRVPAPLVEIDILASRVFSVAMVAVSLTTIAQYSRLVYIPLVLDNVRGVDEFHVGLVMLPSALGVAITMPIGGRLVDRIGARIPVTVGAATLGASFVALATTTTSTSLPVIAAILFVGGLGTGMAAMAPNIIAMNSVPASRVSQASGLANVTRQIAAAVGVAALSSIFATADTGESAGTLDPYHLVFWIAVGLLVAVVVIAQFLPGKIAALALQDDRRREADDDNDFVPHLGEAI